MKEARLVYRPPTLSELQRVQRLLADPNTCSDSEIIQNLRVDYPGFRSETIQLKFVKIGHYSTPTRLYKWRYSGDVVMDD